MARINAILRILGWIPFPPAKAEGAATIGIPRAICSGSADLLMGGTPGTPLREPVNYPFLTQPPRRRFGVAGAEHY